MVPPLIFSEQAVGHAKARWPAHGEQVHLPAGPGSGIGPQTGTGGRHQLPPHRAFRECRQISARSTAGRRHPDDAKSGR